MDMTINNSTAGGSSDSLATITRQLSSGLRVGQASDDPAGLAVRELLRSDVAALNQGVRNTQDATSLIQTADGAIETINSQLVRMKELATQASTGTYNATQRSIIDTEFQFLSQEVSRIANSTEFNGIDLLNNTDDTTIHFGTGNAAAEDFYPVQAVNATAEALGLSGINLRTQGAAQAALAGIDNAIETTSTARASLGATQNRLEATSQNLQIQSENSAAAESRISDLNTAAGMSNFVREQLALQGQIAVQSQNLSFQSQTSNSLLTG